MSSTALLDLLLEFSRDKLALRERHVNGAQRVQTYDFNNTYQYIINREDTQVGWLAEAVADFGSVLPDRASSLPVPAEKKASDTEHAVIADDFRQVNVFLEKYRPRVHGLANARHRKMLEVILGETVEHRRFFEQMLGGRDDVLGRRTGGESSGGIVLPVRWVEQ